MVDFIVAFGQGVFLAVETYRVENALVIGLGEHSCGDEVGSVSLDDGVMVEVEPTEDGC